MWRQNAERAVAGFVSFLASLVLIFIAPKLEEQGVQFQVAALLASTVSFYLLFEGMLRLAARRRLKHVLGKWLYVTWPESGRKELRYGLMELSLDGLELDYSVTLFDTMGELLASAQGGAGGRIGQAQCMAMRYNEKTKRVYIFWGADFNAQREPQRYGRLMLDVEGGKRLDGEWSSTPNKVDVACGGMVATRLWPGKGKKSADSFTTAHNAKIEAEIRSGVLVRDANGDPICAKYAAPAPIAAPAAAPPATPPPPPPTTP